MAIKQNFHYKSSDGIHKINGYRWLPEQGAYLGIIQIVHGMVEFVDRYDDFARFLCDHGYIVVGEDHLGHGGSVNNEGEWGYFPKYDGFNYIIKDLHTLHLKQAKEFPELPIFSLGHSMGSFLTGFISATTEKALPGPLLWEPGTSLRPWPPSAKRWPALFLF